MASAEPKSLRVLSLDGGGIKGYTSLLILERILRTYQFEKKLDAMPKPCEIFDLIVGTSTGGLIAVMLGRLGMTVEECLECYRTVGQNVFGEEPSSKWRFVAKGLLNREVYRVEALQEEIKRILQDRGMNKDEPYIEAQMPRCRVVLCVTRAKTSTPDVLRNYRTGAASQSDEECTIWEAASATAAAPVYFSQVTLQSGAVLADGCFNGNNNPIREAMAEMRREPSLKDRQKGCILSIGTGLLRLPKLSSSITGFMAQAADMLTNAETVTNAFEDSDGHELLTTGRYFRFSVIQGMDKIGLDECQKTSEMRELTNYYLRNAERGEKVLGCAKALSDPDRNLRKMKAFKQSLMPNNTCVHFVSRPELEEKVVSYFNSDINQQRIFVLHGLGGIGKTQLALKVAQSLRSTYSVFWVRCDRFQNFSEDYRKLWKVLSCDGDVTLPDTPEALLRTRSKLTGDPHDWLIVLDNADHFEDFWGRPSEINKTWPCLPKVGQILITTRDFRFVGAVCRAQDCIRVDPMSHTEAEELLRTSLTGLAVGEADANSYRTLSTLINLLGNIPLAIAQAAANINDQMMTLTEYVGHYLDKRMRMELLREPALDSQTTDDRAFSQSISITWELSFDHLRRQNPDSLTCLCYMGFFDHTGIPHEYLRKLPEFLRLSDLAFKNVVKRLLHLSLVEKKQQGECGLVHYEMHLLVHQYVSHRLNQEDVLRYMLPVAESLGPIIPKMFVRVEFALDVDPVWFKHAALLAEISEAKEVNAPELVPVFIQLFHIRQALGTHDSALEYGTRAKNMALLCHPEPHASWIDASLCHVECLIHLNRIAEAEPALQAVTAHFEVIQSHLGEDETADFSFKLLHCKYEILVGLGKFQETLKVLHCMVESPIIKDRHYYKAEYALMMRSILDSMGFNDQADIYARVSRESYLLGVQAAGGQERVKPLEIKLVCGDAQSLEERAITMSDSVSSWKAREKSAHLYLEAFMLWTRCEFAVQRLSFNVASRAIYSLAFVNRFDDAEKVALLITQNATENIIPLQGPTVSAFQRLCDAILSTVRPYRWKRCPEIAAALDSVLENNGLKLSDVLGPKLLGTIGKLYRERGHTSIAALYSEMVLQMTLESNTSSELVGGITFESEARYEVLLSMALQPKPDHEISAYLERYDHLIHEHLLVHGPPLYHSSRLFVDEDLHSQAMQRLRACDSYSSGCGNADCITCTTLANASRVVNESSSRYYKQSQGAFPFFGLVNPPDAWWQAVFPMDWLDLSNP